MKGKSFGLAVFLILSFPISAIAQSTVNVGVDDERAIGKVECKSVSPDGRPYITAASGVYPYGKKFATAIFLDGRSFTTIKQVVQAVSKDINEKNDEEYTCRYIPKNR